MDEEHPIREILSIQLYGRLEASSGGGEGTIRLSAYYGDYQVETSLAIPGGAVVHFSCPFCKKDLTSVRLCEECRSPMVALEFPRGGKVQFCSKRGCKQHLIEFHDPEADLKEFYREYSPYLE